jgi:DNA-binding NarL/FixJ family response regulator
MGQAVNEMARNRLVRWLQMEMTKRLDEIDGRLDRIEARLDQLSARLQPTQFGSRTIARTAELEATLDRLLAGEVDTGTLARLSLTPTESRVAMALFKGQSAEAYAKEAGISISTARWYVKQIHAKTGVR